MDPLSITASTLTILQTISAAFDAIRQVKGLPKAFKEVGRNLALVTETLGLASAQLESAALKDSARKTIGDVVRSCNEKAASLSEIFQELNRRKEHDKNKNWSSLVSFYRSMLLRLGKAHRVETLMQGILDSLKVLAIHKVFQTACEQQIQKLESASKQLSEVEPSLHDSEWDQGGRTVTQNIASGGTGHLITNDTGTQSNVFGNQFTASGDMNFAHHYYHSIYTGGNNSVTLQWLLALSLPLPYEATQLETIEIARDTPGAGRWLLESQEFVDWSKHKSRKLWCHGIAGAGKTVLASIVIDHLECRYSRSTEIVCIYVYFDDRKSANQNLKSVLASLLMQLLRGQAVISPEIRKRQESGQMHLMVSDLLSMLRSQLSEFHKVYLIVDALDECVCQEAFLETCRELPGNVHTLFTSRRDTRLSELIDPDHEVDIMAHDNDIREYLLQSFKSHSKLQRMIDSERESDPSFLDYVINTIIEKSQGIFLLASLHMEFLATSYDIEKFKVDLVDLSTTIDKYYKAAFQRIERKDKRIRELAIDVLTWLAFAKRRLTVNELAHAIAISNFAASVQAGERDLPTNLQIPSPDDTISPCAGLILVDKEHKFIRLAHSTAESYLRSKTLISENAESKIANSCLTCLNYLPLPQNDLSMHCTTYPLVRYAADHWGNHISSKVQSPVYERAWEFLSDKRRLNSVLPFMTNFEILQEREISGLHLVVYFGLAKLVRKALNLNRDILIESTTARGRTALHWTVLYGQHKFMRLLIQTGANVNAIDTDKRTALHLAINIGDTSSVTTLLASGNHINLQCEDRQGFTQLRLAAMKGNRQIAESLLERGAEIDAHDKDQGFTALRWAAQMGHTSLVKLLLGRGASTEPPSIDQWTLLKWAAREGHEEIIVLLAKRRVDLNATDDNGHTALRLSVRYGRKMTAWLLIQEGVDVNKADNKGFTPLHEAILTNNMSLVFLLVESHADVNLQTKHGHTPLHLAASLGNGCAILFLLQNQADSSKGDINNSTALHSAVTEAHVGAVHTLIWSNNDLVFATDDEKQTALHVAASQGNAIIARILLDYKANINARDRRGYTPLHLAVSQHQEDVVTYLIRKGADVSIPNRKGHTVARSAASTKNKKILSAIRRADTLNAAEPHVENKMPVQGEESRRSASKAEKYSARVDDVSEDSQ